MKSGNNFNQSLSKRRIDSSTMADMPNNHKRRNVNTHTNVSTQNRYECLSNMDTEEQQTVPAKTSVRYPPIIIKETTLENVKSLMNETKIEKYFMKLTSFGYRMQCSNLEDHNTLLKHLDKAKMQYFSYEVPENRLLKFVLGGLYKMDPNEIKQEIHQSGLTTIVEVKEMKINQRRYEDQYVYLTKFKTNSVTIHQLRQIKSLFHTIVYWDHYRRRKIGPTICSRCQNFGHAGNNCKLKQRCTFCGEEHASNTCHLLDPEKMNDQKIICCNCKGEHKASSNECPKRGEYQNIMHNINRRNRNRYVNRQNISQRSSTPFRAKLDDDRHFPRLVTSTTESLNHIQGHGSEACYNLDKNGNYNHNNLSNQNLFSYNEIIEIVNEIVDGLSTCTTKQEQIKVIAQITIKYLSLNG